MIVMYFFKELLFVCYDLFLIDRLVILFVIFSIRILQSKSIYAPSPPSYMDLHIYTYKTSINNRED